MAKLIPVHEIIKTKKKKSQAVKQASSIYSRNKVLTSKGKGKKSAKQIKKEKTIAENKRMDKQN